jgi:hypothetical protein
VDSAEGNPPPSSVLEFSAPPSLNIETARVSFPIGDEFVYDPIEFGPAVSLDFSIDVMLIEVSGTSDVDITLAILQGEYFIISPTIVTPSISGLETDWTNLSQTGLQAVDFLAVDGGTEIPDFGKPFQFGYAFTGNYSTTGLTVELGLDNMEATINTVPEPTSIMLVLAMGVSVLWCRWWSDHEKRE